MSLSRWQQDLALRVVSTGPFDIVKMHWRTSRFTVTYADGSRWCNIKDLELFGFEEELQWLSRK